MSSSRVRAVTIFFLALTLTSCAATDPSAEVNSSSVAPSSEQSPAAPQSLEELVITPAGLGSLKVGRPFQSSPMVEFDADYCAGNGAPESEIGRWVDTYNDDSNSFVPLSEGTDKLSALVVYSPALVTAEGVHVGSTLDELTAAYPDLTQPTTGNGISTARWLDAADGRIKFEVLDGDEFSEAADEESQRLANTVSAITISSLTDSFPGTYYGIDGPGGCA